MSSRSFTPPKATRSITSFCLPNIRAEYIVHSPHLSFMVSRAFDTFRFRSREVSNKLSCIEVASDKSKQDTSSLAITFSFKINCVYLPSSYSQVPVVPANGLKDLFFERL